MYDYDFNLKKKMIHKCIKTECFMNHFQIFCQIFKYNFVIINIYNICILFKLEHVSDTHLFHFCIIFFATYYKCILYIVQIYNLRYYK